MTTSPDQGSSTSIEPEGAQAKPALPDDVQARAGVIHEALEHRSDQPLDVVGLEREIRRRQEAESTLRDSETRYRLLYDNNPTMYFTLSPQGTVVSVNQFGATQLGYQPTELIGQSVLKVFRTEEHQAVLGQLVVCAASPLKVFQWEIQKVRKDGSSLWVKERAQAITDERGQILVLIVCEDITERRLTEDCIRESEERWRALFEHAGVGIAQLGLNGRFLRVNPRLCETLGYSSKTLLQRTFQEMTHPDDLPLNLQYLNELAAGKRPSFSMEKRYRRSDDVWVWVNLTVSLVRNASSVPTYFIAVVQNIAEQKRAEEALRRSEQAVRQAFEERERLSQDLHDNLLQSLYAVGMGLELTKHRIQRVSHRNAKRLEDSVGQLNGVIREVRSFIPRMQPLIAQDRTLADALRALTESFVSTGAGEIALDIDDEAAMHLSAEQSTHVLAIAKEALSNSIRHTKAAKRTVRLRRQRRTICLEIADNGRGFSLARRRSHGMGLKNMRARARKLRARIAIASALNKGTTVTLSIPS